MTIFMDFTAIAFVAPVLWVHMQGMGMQYQWQFQQQRHVCITIHQVTMMDSRLDIVSQGHPPPA